MKYQILDAVFRFHVFNLTRKHHLVGFADLPHNIDERIIVQIARHIKPFRVVIATDDIFLKTLI